MSKVKAFKNKISVQEEAAHWVIELDKGDLNQAQQRELSDWLKQSKRNETEFFELAEIWGLADQLKDWVAIETDESEPSSGKRGGWQTPQAIAASVFAVFVLFTALLWPGPQKTDELEPKTFQTAVGEISEISLSDASTVSLNTNSNIEVIYSETARRVILHSGEALFTVTKDKQRPFSVQVGDNVVTAVGTAFNIRKTGPTAKLTVTEGIVSIADHTTISTGQNNHNTADNIMVNAGEEVIFKKFEKPQASPSTSKEIERNLSWTSGMLSFEDTPLLEAIEEISRYTDVKIVLADESLKSLKIGGYFKAGETDSMLQALQLSFNIEAQTSKDNVVLLKKNDDQRALY
ncbi:FecR family protein [Gilvimarinus sp. 1_MG-2023]|uniref:FecR family protein n=1 Tax=Gilvimarinus sp. 1_MG-2023 TaxID=3062638 RepID=UPI0026E29540|nr:FecR family protein [Gilvimarinus sp. 1_MG-2023]MDO6745834.1 FecR family protein [Gilvimarinus sp. 1_MG-2023]